MSQPDDMDAQITEQERLIREATAKLAVARAEKTRSSKAPAMPGDIQRRRRAALLSAVTDQDLSECFAKLVSLAKRGNLEAIKEVLDRVLGRPLPSDVFQQITELEERVTKLMQQHARPMRIAKE